MKFQVFRVIYLLILCVSFSSAFAEEAALRSDEKVTSEVLPAYTPPPVFVIKETDKKIDGEKLLREVDIKGLKAKEVKEEAAKVEYFIEVRYQNKLEIHDKPVFYDKRSAILKSSQIIKIEDTMDGYLDKLRQERKGLGIFKKVKVFKPEDIDNEKARPETKYVYDDFKTGYTITPFEQPMQMVPVFTNPLETPVITVFASPGPWTQQSCRTKDDLCVAWLDQYAQIYLLDTKLIYNPIEKPADRLDLYYHIGFEYNLPSGETKKGAGWVHSRYLQRKIDRLPLQLAASRMPAAADFLDNRRIDNLFVFNKNQNKTDKLSNYTKDMSQNQLRTLASVWNMKLEFDAMLDATYTQIDHSWLKDPITVMGPSAGIGGQAPIFLDLMVKGFVKVNAPAYTSPDDKKPVLVNSEQWLQFVTPMELDGSPVKFGIGTSYFTMLNTDSTYGVTSLLGIQFRLLYERPQFRAYVKYAPVGESLQLDFRNNQLTLGVGYRFNESKTWDSYGVYLENWNMYYESPNRNRTRINQYSLGLFKEF